jgi:hypothetical protein
MKVLLLSRYLVTTQTRRVISILAMASVGLSTAAIALAGVVAAFAYFVWRMYEERSFYKNMVCLNGYSRAIS